DPGVPSSSPYRRWQIAAQSAPGTAEIVNLGGEHGKVVSFSTMSGLGYTLLQLGWLGSASAGGSFSGKPQEGALEYDFLQDWSPGQTWQQTTLWVHRNPQLVVETLAKINSGNSGNPLDQQHSDVFMDSRHGTPSSAIQTDALNTLDAAADR